jgi:hypothetical protein
VEGGTAIEVEQMQQEKSGINIEAVSLLAKYMFLTDQMGWKRRRGNMEGFQPKHWFELTKDERASALKYLMYLKEKRDGNLKG